MTLKRFLVLVLLVAVAAGFGLAQITQTGSLNGTVIDADKALLPNVQVTIKSPALILPQMTMATNDRGFFRFPSLPPGLYTVTFELSGFTKLIREQIRVTVGTTTTLDASLEQKRLEESVTVIGQSPTVDKQKTTLITNLTAEFLQSVPATRSIDTYFNMVPGVTADTAHGSGERDNTYNLDGVNVTDPVTGTRAGTFSVDIMEEISVQTAGHPAEYGSVRGGVINVVTKSGGNRLSGSANVYYRNNKLQGSNVKGTVFEGSFTGFDYEIEPGTTLGGPILKDKLWFFGNLSFYKSSEYVNGYPYDKQPTNIPIDYFRPYPYLKLTFQASASDRVVLSYNFSNYIRHHRDAGYTQTEDTTWQQTTPAHTVNVQWSHIFNSNFLMNLKAIAFLYQLNLTAKHPVPNIYDSTLRRNYQSYGYDDIYRRNRIQALTDATYFVDNWMGRHEFKAGAEFEFSWDSRNRVHYKDPVTGMGPFIYVKNGVPDYVSFYHDDFTRKDRKMVISGFLQDTWTPLDRLTLNLGLRFDHQEGIIPKQGEDRQPVEYGGRLYDPRVTSLFKPLIWNTLSPRLGLVFDVTGDGKTVFKASYNRLFVANIMQWFVWVNPNAFISYRYRLNPDFTPTGSRYNFSAQAAASMDPDLKSPYIDEFTVGIEREIIRDFRLGLRYLHKLDRDLIEGVDRNQLDFEALMRGDDIFSVWTNYTPVYVTDPYDGSTVVFWNQTNTAVPTAVFYTNPPGATRDYNGLEVMLEKRFTNGWQFQASYVYAYSRGLIGTDFDDSSGGSGYYNNPNSHINAVGEFPNERKHQFKLSGLIQGPWGINFSFYYRYLDGNHWARVIRSQDFAGLTLNQGNTSIFAEKRGSRKYPSLNILDIHLEKTFRLPGKLGQLGIFADVFNILNINTTTGINTVSSYPYVVVNNQNVPFGGTTGIYSPPRVLRLGGRFEF